MSTPDAVAARRGSRGAESIKFTVDAALLRELGERLVGRPHIALAELIKNSYDADADVVVVTVGDDEIEVADNGHGMTFDDFKQFWMRIGSPHKEQLAHSRDRGRALTGSKGVGRLAVQFLARQMGLTTRAKWGSETLTAEVDWSAAVQSVDLTEAEAVYTRDANGASNRRFPDRSAHGTSIRLSDLRHRWSESDFVELAREVWALQPPFGGRGADDFRIDLRAADEDLVQRFDEQMRAWLHLWHARLRGESLGPTSSGALKVRLTLEFEGEPLEVVEYEVDDCPIVALDFEIRVYSLHHKQRFGIKVADAREYLRRNGGVHIYDAGFHLPYYGPETDWLRVEADHSHRLSRSALLPENLQVPEGLNYLPTNARLYGVVNVDTGRERTESMDDPADRLAIQMSRDRLVGNRAFDGLVHAVRWALDYYAMQEAGRAANEAARKRDAEPLPTRLDELSDAVATQRDEMSAEAFRSIDRAVKSVVKAGRAEQAALESEAALLGSLATAGMAALATEHEINLQLEELRRLAADLRRNARRKDLGPALLVDAADRLTVILDRLSTTRRLFAPLLDEEDREREERLNALHVVETIVEQARPLLRDVEVEVQLEEGLLLPIARFADWSALFQNVLINAVNAMLDARRRQILVRSRSAGRRRSLLVEDTGSGVDLNTAEQLFEPFIRHTQLSKERRMLGLGGTGLGLTIVRMIARNARCSVAFAEPDEDFSTAFELSWTE